MFHLLIAVIYLAFISLGLPDSILGAAWPSMYGTLGVSVSFAGVISMIISIGTIISSLFSDRLTRRLGAGKVTAISVALTAIALFGFSLSSSFLVLCLWAVPYGLGAGSVDAALNNYVAVHYSSRHMSWLHCMWGIGASVGPYIMGAALTGNGWQTGYRWIAMLQIVLTFIIVCSLPLWKDRVSGDHVEDGDEGHTEAMRLGEVLKIPGAKPTMVAFFCYCALEQTTGLWAASYLVLHYGVEEEKAAFFASLFYIGITAGRGVSGFIANRFSDEKMVRMGDAIILAAVVLLMLPVGEVPVLVGLIAVGVGCAPIYPSMLHATPRKFGAERSQAVMGMQMACAYVGTCSMPTLFGVMANHIGIFLYPLYLCVILVLMITMNAKADRILLRGKKKNC